MNRRMKRWEVIFAIVVVAALAYIPYYMITHF